MNAAPGTRLGLLSTWLRTCVRQAHTGRAKAKPGYPIPEGHGEKIWVFAHRRTEQIIYSFKDKLDGHHDLKQLPFNGKKTKPAKLRKDYWSPMAMIEFPVGKGSVGRSVFQKLRELKHLHEVAWSDEIRYKDPSEYSEEDKKKIREEQEKGKEFRPVRSKKERGIALNAQKKNAIADMAVVLAGQGPGNKVAERGDDGSSSLVQVTVNWSNDLDRNFAESWPENVTHGVFKKPAYLAGSSQPTQPAPQEAPAEALAQA
ncbi:hypothetical protein HIM_03340 [Hirsutella minnesotensis 3608]|uniref:Large ribosomal subunit protein mL67 n=1 Tax=Hirsutella minnesotensis 3608 TaxID=1043627 RepID=A0A0F8A6G1_9HYPO|nr:hypothetical protein HIM_03340 [Hirsutella minnesotensis 3608]